MKQLFLFLTALFISSLLLGQAPQKMSYQAVLRNNSNALIQSKRVGMQISILQGSSGGTVVYAETQSPTSNSNGLVSMEIGSGTIVTGTFASISWGAGPYFIKTETDPEGGSNYTITGMTQLLSVPYALYAVTSGSATSSNFLPLSGGTLTGDLLFTDNIYDIGASGSTRPRTGYFGTSVITPTIISTNDASVNGLTIGLGGGKVAENVAVGFQALASNTTGVNNTATGYHALWNNTTGMFNSAYGSGALWNNTIGSYNTAYGPGVLWSNTTGYNNVGIGSEVLNINTTGNDNTALGNNSLLYNTTGSNNTTNGSNSLFNNTIGDYNTASGVDALHANTVGSNNVAMGSGALFSNTSGAYNVGMGPNALYNITSGSNNIGIGSQANVPFPNQDNQIRLGNTSITYAGIQVPWTITSDKRWKENIKTSDLGLNFILKLRPVSYTRINAANNNREYGFIAQELKENLTASNAENTGMVSEDEKGMLSVRYNDLLAPMVKAIQDQQKQIEELKAEVEKLKNHNKKTF